MMTRLYVAAGGGGDALAAAILHSVIAPDQPAAIATMAWDRLIIDPLPGPRSIDWFVDLEMLGPRTWSVTTRTGTRPPAGSALPRLAGEIGATLLFLDPQCGARGLADQIRDAIAIFQPEWVDLVDVGGDIVALGDEKELRSPLADCLTLAACADLPVPTSVIVAGPGIDGELPEEYVLERMRRHFFRRLRPADVVPYGQTFLWHPSEATALWAAASAGARGLVEVRDGSVWLRLTERSADVFRCPHAAVFEGGPLAEALAGTTSFTEAENVVRRICGFSETDRETRKATKLGPALAPGLIQQRMAAVSEQARARGANFVTFRRLAEAVGLGAGQYERFRADLIGRWPERCIAGLWSVNPVPVNGVPRQSPRGAADHQAGWPTLT